MPSPLTDGRWVPAAVLPPILSGAPVPLGGGLVALAVVTPAPAALGRTHAATPSAGTPAAPPLRPGVQRVPADGALVLDVQAVGGDGRPLEAGAVRAWAEAEDGTPRPGVPPDGWPVPPVPLADGWYRLTVPASALPVHRVTRLRGTVADPDRALGPDEGATPGGFAVLVLPA